MKSRPIITAIRDAIHAAGQRDDLSGEEKATMVLDLVVDGADAALKLPEPWETVTDFALRNIVRPLLAGVIHDLYEMSADGEPREGEVVEIIMRVLVVAKMDGATRDAAIGAALDAAIDHLDERIKPANRIAEGASDAILRRIVRPMLMELADEGADRLAGWSTTAQMGKE